MFHGVRVFGAVLLLASIPSCIAYCNTDADCDNGVWCDGEEFCEQRPFVVNLFFSFITGQLGRGECADREPPCCPAERDCLVFPFRQVAIELCDEALRQCQTGEECRTDAQCDDGIWCNGDEFCTSGFCFDLLERCDPSATCDEEAMRCEESNPNACYRVLEWCPTADRTTELAEIALVLGTTEIPDDVMDFGDGVCRVPETTECDWPSYADCITANVSCEELNAGHPEDALAACLNILPGRNCFADLDKTSKP